MGKRHSIQLETILLIIAALLGSYVSSSCPENFFTSVDNLCCRLCQKGTFLKKPCNESMGTSLCEPCPHSTYMANANNKTKCEPCKLCGPSQIALVECGPNRNRECGCEKAKYHDPVFLYCMDCLKCTVGEGVVSPCSQTSNTNCQPCSKGTFSDKESFELPCKKCSQCEPAELMVVKEECNASRDTICERANLSVTLITATQNLASVTLAHVPTSGGGKLEPITKERSTRFQYIIPIISIGLVICIFLIAIYYIVKKRRRGRDDGTCNSPGTVNSELAQQGGRGKRRAERSCVTNVTEETEVNEYHFPVPATSLETPAQARSSHGLRGRRTTTHATSVRSNSQNQRDSDSQGSSSSLQSVSIGNGKNKMLVRDLPAHIYIDLGRLLNPKAFNNWIKLAGLLDFTNSHVKNFELQPEGATQAVLHEWGQKDGSTVDVLIDLLKQMNRADCVQVLKQWDN